MTSGNFTPYPVDSITIRPDRQRREVGRIEELAQSIARSGLIHPPVITKDGVLVVGERRLTAVKSLGWTHIPVQFAEDLAEEALHLIELEENVRRVDISWQEQCLAVERYHQLKLNQEKDWTATKTAEALGMTKAEVTQRRSVAVELDKGNERVAKAEKYSVARGIVERNNARAKTQELSTLEIEEPSKAEKPKVPILNTDFMEWVATYDGPKFNFIHCDFPYGVNVGGHGQAADQAFGNYDDDPDVYWKLLRVFANNLERIVDDSAHCMFWFGMQYYTDTRDFLRDMGWKVTAHPLVWYKSDNSGILPDANRGPRRNYETAFLCSRGDRFIVRATSNVYAGPNVKTIHMSEKPIACLEHFFRMFVDEHSIVLDPTCGSANALKAAQRLGAKRVLGIEKIEEFYKAAVEAWDD